MIWNDSITTGSKTYYIGIEINIRHLRENVSFLECEGQVLIDNFAKIAVNVVADDWNRLLVRGDEVNQE